MTLKNRTIKVNKDKSLSKYTMERKIFGGFFQWLKVCVDLEGSSIEFNLSQHKGGIDINSKGDRKKVVINKK